MEEMEKTVMELKERLDAAWSAGEGIKQRDILLDCISKIEVTKISTNLLLSTRLGKAVNELRRALPPEDVHLAKRIKRIVGAWKSQGQEDISKNGLNGNVHSPTLNSPVNGPITNGHRPGNRLDQIKQEYNVSPKLASTSSSPILVNGRHYSSPPNFPSSPAAQDGSPLSRIPASPAVNRVLMNSASAPKIHSFYNNSPSVAQGVKRRSLSRDRNEVTTSTKTRLPSETETSSTPGSGLKLKIKLGGKAVVDRAVENPAKRQRIAEDRSDSPVIGSDSGSGDAFDLLHTPSPTAHKPGREKVKTQKELLEAIRKQNPNLGPIGASLETVTSQREASCDVANSSVMYSNSRNGRLKTKVEEEPNLSHLPGKGPDPVEDELAEILRGLPPLTMHSEARNEAISPDAKGGATSYVLNGSVTGVDGSMMPETSSMVSPSGSLDAEGQWYDWTEAYTDSTRSGERMVILPYIYFPFPST